MKSDKMSAAKKAFEAYDRAVIAAREALADGPPKGLGTAIMMGDEYSSRYTCSECGNREPAKGWKFCPHCGSEIIRFDKPAEPNTVEVRVLRPEHDPLPEALNDTLKMFSKR